MNTKANYVNNVAQTEMDFSKLNCEPQSAPNCISPIEILDDKICLLNWGNANVKKNKSRRVIPERESCHLTQTINEAFSRN
jgi:hypothetical protein